MIAAVHFSLKAGVMIGKKKTNDVQFYCDVGQSVEHLENRRRNRNDEDEIEEEERMRN